VKAFGKKAVLRLLVFILLLSTVFSVLVFSAVNMASAKGLDASIATEKGKITVWYFDAEGKPLQGVKAILNEKTTDKVVATGVSDASGKIVFDGVNEGKYSLITQSDKYMTVPANVEIPAVQNGAKTYNVEIRPKMEEKPETSPTPAPTSALTPAPNPSAGKPGESEKPKPPVGQDEPKPVTPSDPKLPQTGVIRWHMYALLGLGFALFMVGWLIVMLDGKSEKSEKKRVA